MRAELCCTCTMTRANIRTGAKKVCKGYYSESEGSAGWKWGRVLGRGTRRWDDIMQVQGQVQEASSGDLSGGNEGLKLSQDRDRDMSSMQLCMPACACAWASAAAAVAAATVASSAALSRKSVSNRIAASRDPLHCCSTPSTTCSRGTVHGDAAAGLQCFAGSQVGWDVPSHPSQGTVQKAWLGGC